MPTPTSFGRLQPALPPSLGHHWRLFLVEGVVLIILGIAAIVVPPIATLAVEVLVGWILLISGIAGLLTTLRMRRTPGFWWSLCSALAALIAGAVLLAWPLSGTVSLTLILTVFLALEGIASIMLSLSHRHGFAARWMMLLVSGLVDLILAGIIFSGLPATAAWAIGLLVGINLVFGGSALVSMALHARNGAPVT